jgi:hypothetical protein
MNQIATQGNFTEEGSGQIQQSTIVLGDQLFLFFEIVLF